MEELAAGALWSAGSDGPKAKATVNDTRIAVRAAAMQSSDRRGVSVAQERPERSGEPAEFWRKAGIHLWPAKLCKAAAALKKYDRGARRGVAVEGRRDRQKSAQYLRCGTGFAGAGDLPPLCIRLLFQQGSVEAHWVCAEMETIHSFWASRRVKC